jgi:hypothetical protein
MTPIERQIKQSVKALIHASGGGEGAAATIAAATGKRVRQQRMSDVGNVNCPDDHIRLQEVIALEAVASQDGAWPHVTRLLAAQQGFGLMPLAAADAAPADYLHLIAGIIGKGGSVSSCTLEALKDGHLSRAEARAIEGQAWELAVAAFGLARAVQEAM